MDFEVSGHGHQKKKKKKKQCVRTFWFRGCHLDGHRKGSRAWSLLDCLRLILGRSAPCTRLILQFWGGGLVWLASKEGISSERRDQQGLVDRE